MTNEDGEIDLRAGFARKEDRIGLIGYNVFFTLCYWISHISSIHSLRLMAESQSSGMESYP